MATVSPQQQKASAVRKAEPAAARLRPRPDIEAEGELRLPAWKKLAAGGVAFPLEPGRAVGRAAPGAETADEKKASAAKAPPAADVGKEKHDEERTSAAQGARLSGAAEGTAAQASPAKRKEEAAKAAQDAREGRVPTEADRAAVEKSEARAEEAQDEARKEREEREAAARAKDEQKAARAAVVSKGAPSAPPAPPEPKPVASRPVAPVPEAAAAASDKAQPAAVTTAPVKEPPVMRQARGPPLSAERALATAETSAGCPLPAIVLESFAQEWEEDFSAVRVHTDQSAARAAHLLSAEAFTVGEHVYFAPGRFAPRTPMGLALLAHELAHVVQLRSGGLRGLRGVSADGSPAEAAADALVARRGTPTIAPSRDRAPPDPPRSPARGPDDFRSPRVRAPPGVGTPIPSAAAPVLRRASDQARTFFDQGYFAQADAWGGATAVLDEELSADAASDTTSFPTPTASLGPEQQPERPPVVPAPALALEGEILIPGEAEDLAGLGGEASLGEELDLPRLGHLSAGAEGDTSDAQAELDGALDDVPTEFDVVTSLGERPPVALDGSADPAQAEDQELVAHDQAEALRAQAASAVEQGPGAEQVQPTSYHEEMPVPPGDAGVLEPLGEIPEMAQLHADPIPEEVRVATDAAGQEQLQASLAESDTALDAAAADHDAQREQEVAHAEAEQQRLSAEATRAQDAEVERARGEIDDHRAATQEQQDAAVAELDTQAADERTALESDIEARVESDTRAIEDEYAQAEADTQAEKDAKEAEARAEKAEAERKSEDQSWWESALDAIASFFDALLDAVNAIFDALIEAVGAIIEAAKAAVTAIIDAVRDFAVGLVQAFGELLKGLVQDLLGEIFPELAAALTELIDAAVEAAVAAINWVADQLKAGLLALLDSIGAAITALLEAYRAAINAAIAIARAALTGDWAALALMVLEAALTLAGIPPESFYAVISNAMAAIDTILADPGAFVGNVIDAVAAGFQAFADNFLVHLQEGFFAWIVGPLGELGITLPATWDIAGIFSLVMQVLGLTREGIRLVVTEELGETAGLIFDFVWRYVGALITGGLEGLWNEIQNDLGMLWDVVVDGIKSWLLETIVTQAVIRIATMFNPVGALVNALITVWNVYQWLRENAQRIFGIVQAVVDMIASIAAGNIEPAARAVESALASLIPIAISLLANLLGLGGITDKVREVLESVRETVRGAIRSLIRRVKALFTGGDEEVEDEEEPGAEATFAHLEFTAQTGEGGRPEGHRLYAEAIGERARVMAASGAGAPIAQQLAPGGEFEALDDGESSRAQSLAEDAERLYAEAQAAESPEAGAAKDGEADAKLGEAEAILASAKVPTLLSHLRDEESTAQSIDASLEERLAAAPAPTPGTRLPATLQNVYGAWDRVAVLFDRTTNIGRTLAASVSDIEVTVTKDGQQVAKSLSTDDYVRALRGAVVAELDSTVRQPTMMQSVLASPSPSVPGGLRSAIESWLVTAEPAGRAERTEEQLLAQIEQYRVIMRAAGAEGAIGSLDQGVDTPVTETTVSRYRDGMKTAVVTAQPGLADFNAILQRGDLFSGNSALKGELFRQWAQTYIPGISEGTPLLNVNDNGRVRAMADAFIRSGVHDQGSLLVEFKSHGPTANPSADELAQMALYAANLPGTWLVDLVAVLFATVRYVFALSLTAGRWRDTILSTIPSAQVYVGGEPYVPPAAAPVEEE